MRVTRLELELSVSRPRVEFGAAHRQQPAVAVPALPPGRESRDRLARSAVFEAWSRDLPVLALPAIGAPGRRHT